MDPVKGHTGEIYAVSFHPNGVLFASGGQDQKTLIWDLRASQQLSQLSINSGNIKKAALHPDGRQLIDLDCARFEGLLCLQDEARFWLISSNSISLVPGRQPLRDYRQMYDVQMSPDGSIVAIAGCQGEGSTSAPCFQHGVRLYLTGTGQPIGVPLEGHTDVISAMAFSPDGRILVTGSQDRTLRIWDGTSGTSTGTVLRSHTGGITALEFSPDGRRLVSAALDRTIRLWDTSTWLPASQPLRGHADSAYSLAYQPDGKYFFSAGGDRLLVQWETATFKQQPPILTRHTGVISNLVSRLIPRWCFQPATTARCAFGPLPTSKKWDCP